jgi:broad specificity phosphatase PhoE
LEFAFAFGYYLRERSKKNETKLDAQSTIVPMSSNDRNDANITGNSYSSSNGSTVDVVVVARHGERLDYVTRDSGGNWVATADHPFNPPLTSHGVQQAMRLGQHLVSELQSLQCPPISLVYSSPLLRCRQTALGAVHGLSEAAKSTKATSPAAAAPPPPVRVEMGLAESMNEDWFRSWALPGSDGSWGYGGGDYDPATIHPMARQPIQSLLTDWKTDEALDHSYESQIDVFTDPYSLSPPLFETGADQCRRMHTVANSLRQMGTTILFVTHGGPMSSLYEEITKTRHVHGEAGYCAYSIYKYHDDGGGANVLGRWEAVRTNVAQSSYM